MESFMKNFFLGTHYGLCIFASLILFLRYFLANLWDGKKTGLQGFFIFFSTTSFAYTVFDFVRFMCF